MTSQQLQATRALRWRQSANPILTQEDAQAWLQETGLCLFLPRKAQLPAPAPSFVEACLGETNPAPPRTAVETALQFVARLIEANAAIPLNLLGTPADYPDFLVSPDTLSLVYALRGDRDWKHSPGSPGSSRVSPLVAEIWKALEAKAPMGAVEIKDLLGREVTEAAVLRALHELWGSLRVVPRYQSDGSASLWEPLQLRHKQALKAAINMSQVTALSTLSALYFLSAVAATSEQAEVFLSPLSARSKVREVVRGLTATRQLAMTSLDRENLLFVEGSLPEFEEEVIAPAPPPQVPARPDRPRRPFLTESRPRIAESRPHTSESRPKPTDVPAGPDRSREEPPREWKRPAAARPSERSTPPVDREPAFKPRPTSFPRPSERRERPPARPPWKDKGKPGFAQSAAAKDPKARWPREGAKFPARPPRSGPRLEEAALASRPFDRPKGVGGSRPPQRRDAAGEKPRGDFKDFRPRRASNPAQFGARKPGPRRGADGEGEQRRTFRPRPSGFQGEGGPSRGAPGGSPRRIGPPKTADRATAGQGTAGRGTPDRRPVGRGAGDRGADRRPGAGAGEFRPRRAAGGEDPRRHENRPAGRFADQKPRAERSVRPDRTGRPDRSGPPFVPRDASGKSGEWKKPYGKSALTGEKPASGSGEGRPPRKGPFAGKPFGGSRGKSGTGPWKGGKPGTGRNPGPRTQASRSTGPSSRPPRRPAGGPKRRAE